MRTIARVPAFFQISPPNPFLVLSDLEVLRNGRSTPPPPPARTHTNLGRSESTAFFRQWGSALAACGLVYTPSAKAHVPPFDATTKLLVISTKLDLLAPCRVLSFLPTRPTLVSTSSRSYPPLTTPNRLGCGAIVARSSSSGEKSPAVLSLALQEGCARSRGIPSNTYLEGCPAPVHPDDDSDDGDDDYSKQLIALFAPLFLTFVASPTPPHPCSASGKLGMPSPMSWAR